MTSPTSGRSSQRCAEAPCRVDRLEPYVSTAHPARLTFGVSVAGIPSSLDPVINLAKRRGFVFQAGEIYGGSRSAWDYGPLGTALKENIKRQWWQFMVQGRDDIVGIDSAVILPRKVWEASGHVEVFSDPLVESLHTHKRYRADHLIEAYEEKHGHPPVNGLAGIKDPETGQS